MSDATETPYWLKKPPKSERAINSPLPPRVVHTENPFKLATIGIVIIATLMLLVFWFWVSIAIAGWLNPPEAEDVFGMVVTGDYLSTGRMWFGIMASVVLTGGTWVLGHLLAD